MDADFKSPFPLTGETDIHKHLPRTLDVAGVSYIRVDAVAPVLEEDLEDMLGTAHRASLAMLSLEHNEVAQGVGEILKRMRQYILHSKRPKEKSGEDRLETSSDNDGL